MAKKTDTRSRTPIVVRSRLKARVEAERNAAKGKTATPAAETSVVVASRLGSTDAKTTKKATTKKTRR